MIRRSSKDRRTRTMTPISFLLMLQAAPPPGVSPTAGAPASASVTPAGRPADASPRPILTLTTAEQNALHNHPQVREARSATDAAVARIEEARSGYLPQVTGTATYERTTANVQPRPGFTSSGSAAEQGPLTFQGATGPATFSPASTLPPITWNPNYSFFQFGVTATQLLYDFGQTSEKWRSAARSADSFRAGERTTKNQVLLNVRTAYFNARAAKALMKVAVDTLENQEKHLAQVMGMVGAGTEPEIDLATSRTAVANARVALINAQNQYDVTRAQLNLAMGIVASTDYDVADEGLKPIDGEDQPNEPLVAKALSLRPELVNFERQREAQELTVKSIKGGYGPTIAAIGNLSLIGIDLGSLVPDWYVGASLTWPILQGGLTRGQVREAQANLRNIDAELEAERQQVHLDVEQARLAVRAAKASIDAAQEALVNARLQLKLAEGRYAQGVGSIIELSDAQVAMTSAAAQAVQADYNLATARAQLLTALGQP
jgi:outer membrane protein